MKCEHCGEEIKWSVLVLQLPSYASNHELYFCNQDCMDDWIDEFTHWEEVESEIDEY